MENLNPPQVLPMPFANNGTKNTIPTAPTGNNKASLTEGFPVITSTPTPDGGIPPERADFNGVMNLNSQFYFAFQNGWLPTFNPEVSTAIGGYSLNAILWHFDVANNKVRPVRSLIGNNTYNFNTNTEYIGQYWSELVTDGQGLPVGAIYFSQSSSKNDNQGALPLFSGETIENFSELYPVFYRYITGHTELCKTSTEYDSMLSTYGECPFYVHDTEANTLRLPILKNYLKMANTTSGITQSVAGLPNLSGQAGNNWYDAAHYGTAYPINGVFKKSGTGTVKGSSNGGGDYYPFGVDFDASRNNTDPVYGKSTTVTPAHTTVFPWVVAYHAEMPDASQQVAEIIEAGTQQLEEINTAGIQQTNDINTAGSTQVSAVNTAGQNNLNTINTTGEEYVQEAKDWANKTSGPVADGEYSAKKYAEDAAQSAQNSRGMVMGTVYFSQFSTYTQNPGALPLFTGETITGANTLYPDFYAAIAANTGLQCTAAEYEASLTTYGECAKYVVSDGNLRLPLIKNYIKAANTTDGIKNLEAGLPNITGSIYTYFGPRSSNCTASGAYSKLSSSLTDGGYYREAAGSLAWDFDASRSSEVYGKSDTVTPASTTLYPWVVAFNAAVEASVAQAAEFQQALSGKADTSLANLSTAGKSLASGLGMPSNRYINLNLGASGTTYTAPANGYFVITGTTSSSGRIHMSCSNKINLSIYTIDNEWFGGYVPCKKGDTMTFYYNGTFSVGSFLFVQSEGDK